MLTFRKGADLGGNCVGVRASQEAGLAQGGYSGSDRSWF